MFRAMVKALTCPTAEPNSKSEKRARKSGEVPDFQLPVMRPKKTKISENAPVQIGMQHYSDNSMLCGLPGSQDKVVVLLMEHNAKPCHFL